MFLQNVYEVGIYNFFFHLLGYLNSRYYGKKIHDNLFTLLRKQFKHSLKCVCSILKCLYISVFKIYLLKRKEKFTYLDFRRNICSIGGDTIQLVWTLARAQSILSNPLTHLKKMGKLEYFSHPHNKSHLTMLILFKHSPQRGLRNVIYLLILFSTLFVGYISSLLFHIVLLLTK